MPPIRDDQDSSMDSRSSFMMAGKSSMDLSHLHQQSQSQDHLNQLHQPSGSPSAMPNHIGLSKAELRKVRTFVRPINRSLQLNSSTLLLFVILASNFTFWIFNWEYAPTPPPLSPPIMVIIAHIVTVAVFNFYWCVVVVAFLLSSRFSHATKCIPFHVLAVFFYSLKLLSVVCSVSAVHSVYCWCCWGCRRLRRCRRRRVFCHRIC